MKHLDALAAEVLKITSRLDEATRWQLLEAIKRADVALRIKERDLIPADDYQDILTASLRKMFRTALDHLADEAKRETAFPRVAERLGQGPRH